MTSSEDQTIQSLLLEIDHKVLDNTTVVQEQLLPTPKNFNDPFPSDINFQHDMIAAAPYGGSIAVLHSNKRYTGSQQTIISLYDPLLNLMAEIRPLVRRKPIGLYVTPEELIVMVYDDTTVLIMTQKGQPICQTSVTGEGTVQAKFAAFWETGLFIVTYSGKVFICDDFASCKLRLFARCDNSPDGGCAVPPTLEQGPILWAFSTAFDSYVIQCIQEDNVQEQEISTCIKQISFSANYSLACAISDTSIIIFNNDFSNAFVELELPGITVDRAIFVGNDTVLATCGNQLLMVGVTEKTLVWDLNLYGGGCWVTNEVDGARVIFKDSIIYIRPVTGAPLQLIDDAHPDSDVKKLFDAVSSPKKFAKKDPIDELLPILDSAVKGCLEAVQFLRDSRITHALLGVIAKSKHRLSSFDSEQFTQAVQFVRLCDQLALPPFNMPLTQAQLHALHVDRLLIRLCNRYLHFYASRIADYVNEKVEPIYTHWTNCLIRAKLSPAEVLKKIEENNAVVDFIDLATSAKSIGDTEMFLAMLNANKVKARSVPLYMEEGKWQEAVSAAVESNDTTLLLYVLRKAQESGKTKIISDCLAQNPIALDAWLKLHPDDPEKEKLLLQAGRVKESDLILFQRSLQQNGQGMEKVKEVSKQAKDSLTVSIADRFIQIKKFRESNNVPAEVGNTPNDLFIWSLQQKGTMAKKCAKILGLQKDEILMLKLECYRKMPEPKNIAFLEEIGENDDEETVMNIVKYLVEDVHDRLTASKLVSQVYDGPFKDELKAIVNKK